MLLEANTNHRLVLPLYIPFEEEYYKEAYSIFKLTLNSAIKTSSSLLKVSVIANGCCISVHQKLYELVDEGVIDELIIETEAIGKLNSLLKVLRTVKEPLVTVADADVLFLNGWETAIIDVFNTFPKAGAVCPTPVFRKHNNHTSNIWIDYFFSNKLKFTPVVNKEAMTRFAMSIGWPCLEEKFKDVYLTLETANGFKAMVGCSHFVATYKKEVFNYMPANNSVYQLGGDSEDQYLDLSVVKAGGYRFSTIDNYAYHLGNKLEDWHLEEYNLLKKVDKTKLQFTSSSLKSSRLGFYLKGYIYKALFYFKPIKKYLLIYKGLTPTQATRFLE